MCLSAPPECARLPHSSRPRSAGSRGHFAQPAAFSPADDDISDLGAQTASSPWLYNQVGANLTGILVMAAALGLWRALSPDVLGRIGAGALFVAGLGAFLDGWRPARIPSPAALPAIILANAVFSTLGNGAAVRAGTMTWFAWLAYLGVLLLAQEEQQAALSAEP